MADESTTTTGRLIGRTRSKWSKILSKEDSRSNDGGSRFKLNDDVVDFLKPSTEKYSGDGTGTRQHGAPRIDVAIAPRWPEPAEIRRAESLDTGATSPASLAPKSNGRPPKRRAHLNLRVAFVKTLPEIIGEGGDDAETPVLEISRIKAKTLRSFSDHRPPALNTMAVDPYRSPQRKPVSGPARDPYSKPTIQRAYTVNHGSTPPIPPQHRSEMPRPGFFKRMPTGYNTSQDQPSATADMPRDTQLQHSRAFDQPVTDVTEIYESPVRELVGQQHYLQTSGIDTQPPSTDMQHRMRLEEGRALKKMSQINLNEVGDLDSPPLPHGFDAKSRISVTISEEPDYAYQQEQSLTDGCNYARPPSPQQTRNFTVVHDPRATTIQIPVVPVARQQRHTSQSSLSPEDCRHLQPRSLSSPRSDYNRALQPPPSPQSFTRMPHPDSQKHSVTPTPGHEYGSSYFTDRTITPKTSFSSIGRDSVHQYSRPVSQASHYRDMSPSSPSIDPAELAALSDFSSRVAHTKDVFRLTAERERSLSTVSANQWLRAAIWWMHKGKAGLAEVVKTVSRGSDGQRQTSLTQAHVDVAKTWWILSDILEQPSSLQSNATHTMQSPQDNLRRDISTVQSNLRTLCVSMARNNVMPPHQSLIQGQDTAIWLNYPRFTTDASGLLVGRVSKSVTVDENVEETNPVEALPLGDTRETFCYSRMFVNASLNTDDAETDRVDLPCILTMLRGKSDFQTKITISSQIDLVNICIRPDGSRSGRVLTWKEVSWKARSHGIYITLPRGFTLNVDFQENDFRALWNMVEFTRKTQASLAPQPDERLIHEGRLTELQYSDPANPHAFTKERVRACLVLVFEKILTLNEGTGARKLYRGYRLLLVTSPTNKTLSSVNHDIGMSAPLSIEMSGSAETTEILTMTIRIQGAKGRCKATLVFGRDNERLELYNAITGMALRADESYAGRAHLKSLEILDATQPSRNSVLSALHWKELRVVNDKSDGSDQTVLSDHLKVIAIHDGGSLTDRMNLGPGEMLLRIQLTQAPTLQVLRGPQQDMTMSADPRRIQPAVLNGLTDLSRMVMNTPTIRTLTFSTVSSLHAFQQAITGYTVAYDAPAALFAISRRRAVVAGIKRLEATRVRLQIVSKGNVMQILAFFEEFAYADAMAFQIRSTDVFEMVKSDKSGKYCVKLVDAKFSLPKKEKDDEQQAEAQQWGTGTRRRFVNLEGLEYAGEHDDITIGFDTEEEYNRFCEALPSATSSAKSMMNLKRRI